MKKTYKVVISGPESVGKSTLTKYLSEYFKSPYITELARDYLKDIGTNYKYEDIEKIARLHIETEKEILQNSPEIIFYDTDLINIKVWFLDVYKRCPDWILNHLLMYKPDMHLLCYPDLAWEYDPLRENPYRRDYFFNIYKSEIEKLNINYKIISGQNQKRFDIAIDTIKELIS